MVFPVMIQVDALGKWPLRKQPPEAANRIAAAFGKAFAKNRPLPKPVAFAAWAFGQALNLTDYF